MIVSASRRTDIPAFHTEWFLNRIREGYCIVTHHAASGIYQRVPLTTDVVDCIVFRSKNPAPMLGRLDALRGYNYLFNITMNPYGREMEIHVPRIEERIETFKKLSRTIDPLRMIWRYDPVFLSPKYDLDFHRRAFEYLCRELQGWSYKCMIGFIIHHPFVARRIDPLSVRRRETEDIRTVGRLFGETARRYGHRIETCAEATDLEEFGSATGPASKRRRSKRSQAANSARSGRVTCVPTATAWSRSTSATIRPATTDASTATPRPNDRICAPMRRVPRSTPRSTCAESPRNRSSASKPGRSGRRRWSFFKGEVRIKRLSHLRFFVV